MKKKIQHLILMEYEQGKTHFVILGDNELADIIELSLKNLNKSKLKYRRVSKLEDINSDNAVVLLAESKTGLRTSAKTNKYIDVLAALSDSQR